MIPFKLGRGWTISHSGQWGKVSLVHWCIPRGQTLMSMRMGCPNCGELMSGDAAQRACWYAGWQGLEPDHLGRLAWELRVGGSRTQYPSAAGGA